MRFDYLSRDLWPIAEEVARLYRRRRFAVGAEAQVSPLYGFRPTLVCAKAWDRVCVEVRSSPLLDGTLEDFIKTAAAQREGMTMYIALPRERDGEEIALPASFIDGVRKYGIGVFLVSSGNVEEKERGVRFSLRFAIPPGRGLGRYKDAIEGAVKKFNRGDHVDGLRDMTEAFERAVGDLALKAVGQDLVQPSLEEVEQMDLGRQINLLGAPEWGGNLRRGSSTKT